MRSPFIFLTLRQSLWCLRPTDRLLRFQEPPEIGHKIVCVTRAGGGTWLAQLVDHTSLDLWVMSSTPVGHGAYLKNRQTFVFVCMYFSAEDVSIALIRVSKEFMATQKG